MIDWNGNGKLDPVDIGISMVLEQPQNNEIELAGYTFKFIQELKPQKTLLGKIYTYDPKGHYEKKDQKPLNRYGEGPFCRVSISEQYSGVPGVYALFDDNELLYIGQTVNLAQRYNQGYGKIEPVNCYVGGQSTNCKINSMILNKYMSSNHVFLYFLQTKDYDRIERELIRQYKPPYNSQYAEYYEKTSGNYVAKKEKRFEPEQASLNNKAFEEVWQHIVEHQGEEFRTKTGIVFKYKVIGEDVIPLHIASGNPKKRDFLKAYELGIIQNISQLNAAKVMGPSYVFAIITDSRIQ